MDPPPTFRTQHAPCKHAIRLRGPWECRPLARRQLDDQGAVVSIDAPLPAAGALTVPGDWRTVAGDDFRGLARFIRRFGRPTGLEPRDRVFLAVEQIGGRAFLYLQGEKLVESPLAPALLRIDVTDRLQAANELWIDVEWLGEPLGESTDRPSDGPNDRPNDAPNDAATTNGSASRLRGGAVGDVRLEICDP